ncbi:MAG: dihydrodipicolinate synthase family protein [Vicinamibacterales bacterium]
MTPDGFVRDYSLVADASPAMVLRYNVQMSTGVGLAPATLDRLAQHPKIVGIKESGGTTFLLALCVGADGWILALAGLVPDLRERLMTLVTEGRLAEARSLQRRLNLLARSAGTIDGVPGLKVGLDLRGLAGGAPCEPLVPAPSSVVEDRQQPKALELPVRG